MSHKEFDLLIKAERNAISYRCFFTIVYLFLGILISIITYYLYHTLIIPFGSSIYIISILNKLYKETHRHYRAIHILQLLKIKNRRDEEYKHLQNSYFNFLIQDTQRRQMNIIETMIDKLKLH